MDESNISLKDLLNGMALAIQSKLEIENQMLAAIFPLKISQIPNGIEVTLPSEILNRISKKNDGQGYTSLQEYFNDVAYAIQQKLQISTPISPKDFSSLIRQI